MKYSHRSFLAKAFVTGCVLPALVLSTAAPALAQFIQTAPTPIVETIPTPAPAPIPQPAPIVEPIIIAEPIQPIVEQTPSTVSTQPITEPTTQSTQAIVAPIITPHDTTPPVISGVLESSLLPTQATIVWSTNELAVSHFRYGVTTAYGSNATLGTSAALVHGVLMIDLAPNTTYYYCIDATDLSNKISTSCGHHFTTAVATSTVVVDANPPTVSLITVAPITTSTASIHWTTNEVADGEIEYGLTAGYGSISPVSTDFALTHSITLHALLPNTEYHYRIKSRDGVDNLAVTPDETFMTESLTQASVTVTAPETVSTGNVTSGTGSVSVPQLIFSSIEAASVGPTEITITWNTDLLSDSQVEYGTSELFGSTSARDAGLTTSHHITLTNLTPNTNYIFRVISKPSHLDIATVSSNHEFNTLPIPTPSSQPANILTVGSGDITASSATVTWTTDAQTEGQIEWGLSTAYDQSTTLSQTFQTAHTLILSDLEPETIYHFRAKAIDVNGNITYSEDQTFTTAHTNVIIAPTPSSTVPSSTTIAISMHDQTSATLTWHVTSAQADAAMEYEIRYATFPINANTIQAATLAQTTPIFHIDLQPNGTSRSYVVAGLAPNTTYYVAVRSTYEHSDWSNISNVVSVHTLAGSETISNPPESNDTMQNDPQNNNASTSPNAPSDSIVVTPTNRSSKNGTSGGSMFYSPMSPTLVFAQGVDSQIVIQWKNPHESSFVRTVVVKKEGGYPHAPTDGTIIYEGLNETFTDTNLRNGTDYFYSLFTYDHAKRHSSPIHIAMAASKNKKEIQLLETPIIIPATTIDHFAKSWKQGDKDIEIEHLQQILAADGNLYPEKKITGYFGQLTHSALKKFQAKHKLPQTGITDAATRTKLNLVSRELVRLSIPGDLVLFTNDLRFGQENEEVANLQEFLLREGSYVKPEITGIYDASTRKSVQTFQRKYRVRPANGYVGAKTRHVIQALTGL